MEDPDPDLLARSRRDPEAFGTFYARHERAVFAYHYRRVRDVELAADLTAETFAAALWSAPRFARGPQPAIAWLLGIARNVLGRSAERRRVESRARRRLGMPVLVLDDGMLEALERVHAGSVVGDALDHLPPDQAAAVRARIVDERDYGDIAAEMQTSEAVIRQRVSRGLGALRRSLEEAP
jgi:RNA polymerase sigma-70 factor (ECF subfamily)